MKTDKRLERIEHANQLIKAISSYGRRFFYNGVHERIAFFRLDDRGAIRFVDDYTARPIYVAYPGRWHGFSHGGTLKSIVQAIAQYIRTGEPMSAKYFGPFPDDYCHGDPWGYKKEEMEKLRIDIKFNPAIKEQK